MMDKDKLLDLILNDSTQMIQVSDLDTFTMLYANEPAKVHTGHAGQSYEGEHCYEYMMGLKEPCPFCPLKNMGESGCKETEVDNGNAIYKVKTRVLDLNGEKAFVEYVWDITKLRRSQKNFDMQMEMLIKSIPEAQGVFHLDVTADTCLSINGLSKSARALTKRGSVDMTVRSIASFVPGEEERVKFFDFFCRDSLIENYEKGSAQLSMETDAYCDDRSIRKARVTARLLMNPTTEHLECVIYGLDISEEIRERITYENHMQEQLEIFHALGKDYLNIFLIDAPRNMAKVLKMDGYVTTGIDKTKDKEYPYYATCEQYIEERVHPEDKEMMRESLKLSHVLEGIADGKEYVSSYRILVDGEVHYFQYKYMRLKDSGHIIAGFQNIDVLIAEERKQQEILEEMNRMLRKEHILQQDYYKKLLDVQSCGLMAYTLPGHKIVHMNAEALRMYGYEKISDVQKNLGSIISGFYYPDPESLEKLSALRKSDGVVDYEFVINKGKENECHALAKTKRFISPSGELLVVTTFLDVSDMVMLEKALKQAEEGNRAKTAFLFNMSHDLRTPMNAIIGYADLMERHWGEQEKAAGYLEKLKAASRFLLSLINNVLEMARIESGKEVLHETVCNISEINKTMDTILDASLKEKHLEFTRNVSVQHENIICDPLKINEIYLNIFSNAVKYTPAGGKITVDVVELPAEKEGCVQIQTTVSDTGIGIGKEYIPHLFESFSRERNSSESGIIGTGLGLPIVKSLVEMMGGTVEVESELGKGTTFVITLCHKLADEEQKKEKDQDKLAKVESLLIGKNILLVEDNELNAEIAATILRDIGIKVELVTDGKEALDRVKEVPAGYYDLILMDIQMPRLDGYQATRQIRALPDERADVPIIAMTANAFEEDKKAAFAAGMNGHIAKPIEIEKMIKTLAEVIS